MQTSLFPDESPDLDSEEIKNPLESLVRLLGNIDHEGITSALKSGGERYKRKVLESSPANWASIVRYFNQFKVRAVAAKLNAHVYDLLADPHYLYISDEVFRHVAKTKNAVFVFEDLLSGEAIRSQRRQTEEESEPGLDPIDREDFRYYRSRFTDHPAAEVLDTVNARLRAQGLNLIPYRTNAEVTVAAIRLLDDALCGLLFRVYVPANRLWANEIDKLLELFRDYLIKTGRKGIRLDQVRTGHGTSYEFHGEETSNSPSLSEEFQDFSKILDLSVSNPNEAELLLREKTVNPNEISAILTRYSKEAKRLHVDLRHDRERKLLNIRQRLESELAEMLPDDTDWGLINMLVAKTVPEALSLSGLTSVETRLLTSPSASSFGSLTINLRPQIINTVTGVVSQEILGDFNLTEDSKQLLSLIQEHGADQTFELTEAVRTLSDEEIPNPNRVTSAQKLKGFLFKVTEKIGPVAANLLTDYIEKRLGLK